MLNPTEYYYLTKPLVADAAAMLKYTVQDLCLRNVLKVEQKWTVVNKRENRERLRFFFSRGDEFDNYVTLNKYENFILKPFKNHEELQFILIRLYIKKKLEKDVHKFKTDYVFPDLKRKNLCFLRIFPTSKGKILRNEIAKKIDWIESLVDSLLENNKELLLKELVNLGSNILFLSKETIEKLNAISEDITKISKLEFLSKNAAAFSGYDTFFAMDSGFGDSFGDFGGGFDGFGGGDFGGGGAGGDW